MWAQTGRRADSALWPGLQLLALRRLLVCSPAVQVQLLSPQLALLLLPWLACGQEEAGQVGALLQGHPDLRAGLFASSLPGSAAAEQRLGEEVEEDRAGGQGGVLHLRAC